MRCHSYRFISIIRFENFMDFLFIFFMHRSETSKQRNRLMKKKSPLNFCIFLSLNFRAIDYLLLILFFMAFHISNRMVLLNEGKKNEWTSTIENNNNKCCIMETAKWVEWFEWVWVYDAKRCHNHTVFSWIMMNRMFFFPSRIVYVWNSCALVLLLFWIEIYELSWYLEFIGIHTI